MAVTCNVSLALKIAGILANSVDIGEVPYPVAYGPTYVLTDGVGANQAKEMFTDIRTLAASATEDLDLAGGLHDVFGNAILFTKIKALIVVADAGNVNDVLVGGAAANQFATPWGAATHSNKVKPGGMLCFVAPDANGYAVTAGTGDLLKVANSAGGTAVSYTIILVGTV